MFEESGVIITVHNPLVQDKPHVQILLLYHTAILLNLQSPALTAKRAENRQVAEVVQVVIDGGDTQAAHGGEEQTTVEGAQLQQELGQHTKVIQQLQQPYQELHQHTGDQIEVSDQIVQTGIQLLGTLDFFDSGIELVVNILGGVMAAQMDLDGCVGRIDGHLLFDYHAVLDVLTSGVHLLAGNKPIKLGIFAKTPDIGSQQHMGQTKVAQTFSALLPDVTLNVGDLKGFLEKVGASVALHLEISGDLGHRCQSTDLPSVAAVAPGGMVLTGGMDTDCKHREDAAGDHQNIRQQIGVVPAEKNRACQIQLTGKRETEQGQKQPCVGNLAAGDLGVKHSHKQQRNGKQGNDHGVESAEMEVCKHEAVVDADHPDGDCGLVELFFARNQCDVRKQQGCCDWQNDLTPHLLCAAGSFHTDEHNAGHCRADHAQRHQPCQQVLLADEEMCSVFHNTVIITEKKSFDNEKMNKM